MKLCLGVLEDKPEYNFDGTSDKTTYDVGMELEERYSLFSKFADNNMDSIVGFIDTACAEAIDALDAKVEVDPKDIFNGASGEILQLFQKDINEESLAGVISGVPTQRALAGLFRLKGDVPGPRRTSFIDSGELFNDLWVWVEP